MNKIIWLLVVLSLTGCAGIPLSSVYKMMTANPLEFDPEAVSIAIKRSNAIQVQTGDVEMEVFINNDNPDLKILEKYFLVIDNTSKVPLVAESLKYNEYLTILTLSPEDVIKMKNLQHKMKTHLTNGGESDDFGFSIRVLKGCKNIAGIPENVFVSLFLKLDLRSEYFPLYQNFNIGQADLSPLKNLENWDDCKS